MCQSEALHHRRPTRCPEGKSRSLRPRLALAVAAALLVGLPAAASADTPGETPPEGRLARATARLIERRVESPAPVTRSAEGRTLRAISPYAPEIDASDCAGCRLLCDSFIGLPAWRYGHTPGPPHIRTLLPMRSLCTE